MKIRSLQYIFLAILLLNFAACKDDEAIAPVNLLEASPDLRAIEDRANQIGEDMQRDFQNTLTQAQIDMALAQRPNQLELMKLTSIKDPKKIELAIKYLSLFEFQLYSNAEDYDLKSLENLLNETEGFFPDKLELKESMRCDKQFKLYALSIVLDTVNPNRDAPYYSFYDIILRELDTQTRKNKERLIYLLQLRHNAIYDLIINYFDKTPISFTRKFTVTGKGEKLSTIKFFHEKLIQADQTRADLSDRQITPKSYKNRLKKIKGMRLKLDPSLSQELSDALIDLHRHIQENY